MEAQRTRGQSQKSAPGIRVVVLTFIAMRHIQQ